MDDRCSNWRDAIERRDLEFLKFLIDAVDTHRTETDQKITPVQLRLVLERGWTDQG